jgi:hypothetical protein
MKLAAAGELFELPRFTYRNLSCWRVFTQLYPESMRLLELAAIYPERWNINQIKSAAVLLSTVASTDEYPLVGRANDALKKLYSQLITSRCNNFEEYSLIRQLHFTLAEADAGKTNVERCLDFIYLHPWEWELRIHRAYYNDPTDQNFEMSLRRKLEQSKPRDLRVSSVVQFSLEQLRLGRDT